MAKFEYIGPVRSLPMNKSCVLMFTLASAAMCQTANTDLGYTDTPMLPGLPYHVHDPARPHPRVVTPSDSPGGPPSDAIVLFDGKDLSHWASHHSNISRGGADLGPAE